MVYRQAGRACPSCGSSQLIEGLRLQDQSVSTSGEGVEAVLYKNPDALVFKGGVSSAIGAEVCGSCGRLDLYVLEPEKLLAAVTPEVVQEAVVQEAAREDTCLRCGAHMPAEVPTCPNCGWTYASGDIG